MTVELATGRRFFGAPAKALAALGNIGDRLQTIQIRISEITRQRHTGLQFAPAPSLPPPSIKL